LASSFRQGITTEIFGLWGRLMETAQ
jgi:hypothetical protein